MGISKNFVIFLFLVVSLQATIYPIPAKKAGYPREGVSERWKMLRAKQALLYSRLKPLQNFGATLERHRNLGLQGRAAGVPSTLTIRVLVLRVEFLYEDPDNPETTGRGKMILTPNDQDSLITENGCTRYNPFYEPPHDKKYFEHMMEYLANYYTAATFGKVKVEFVVKPDGDTASYQLPHDLAYYGDIETWPEGFFALMQDALRIADEDSTIDFGDIDGNGTPDEEEGVLNKYLIFHAGAAWQTDLGDTPLDLPAATILGYPYFYVVVDEGRDTVYEVSILPETMSQDGMEIKLQGTLCHEMGHEMFLFPDLYDISGKGIGIGAWGLMGVGYYLGIKNEIPEGLIVPLPNVWERKWMSWVLEETWGPGDGFLSPEIYETILPFEISEEIPIWPSSILTDTLGDFLEEPGAHPRFIETPLNNHEYYLFEYKLDNHTENDTVICPGETTFVRVEVKDGVVTSLLGENDYLLPGKGLLIFHVDEDIFWDQYGYNEVNAVRPMAIDVEEADGVQDFEYWTDFTPYPYALFGNPYDVFFKGNKSEFSDTTAPNTQDNEGAHTLISIYDISEAGKDSMAVKIKKGGQKEGFPLRLGYSSEITYFPNHSIIVESLPMNGFLEASSAYIFFAQTVRRDSVKSYLSGEEALLSSDTVGIVYLIDTMGKVLDRDTLRNISAFRSGPLFGDLDGDSLPEAVIGSRSGRLFAWKIEDNTLNPLQGFPVSLPEAIYSTPSAFDIDGDGRKEILLSLEDQKLYAIDLEGERMFAVPTGAPGRGTATFYENLIYFLSADGRLFFISPQGEKIDSILPPFTALTGSSIAIGDVDRDSIRDIILTTAMGFLWIISTKGDTLSVRDFEFSDPGSPALGNVDADGFLEIAFLADGKLFVVNHLGNPLSGYPLHLSDSLWISGPVIADVNGDSQQEILVALQSKGIFAYNEKGKLLTGYPLSFEGAPSFPPRLVEKEGSRLDMYVCDSTGTVYGWELQGTSAEWAGFGNDPLHSLVFKAPLGGAPQVPKTLTLSRVYLYPNPVLRGDTRLRFKASRSGKGTWGIYSFAGYKLREGTFYFKGGDFEEVPIELKDIASGVYYLRATFGDKTKILKLAITK